jgi:hypothetical protein
MTTGYERFKTPFYDIYVGGPNDAPSKMIKLPYQILKLIQKVEIVRTFDACLINDIVNITFIEGSREPYSQLFGTTDPLYRDEGSKASLTNKPGLIPDLTFTSGGVGIKALDSVLDKGQDLVQAVTAATSLLPLDGLKFTGPVDIDKPKESVGLKYLLQEGNKIKVTWGYVEGQISGSNKSVISQITTMQTQFPENGSPITTITCTGHEDRLDRISTPIGVKFSKKIPAGADTNTGKLLLREEDLSTKEVIQKICNDAGIKLIISDTLDGDKLNKDNVKKWIAGESLYQLFTRLAHRHNAFFTSYIDPYDGKETIAFIKRSEFEKTSTIDDANLFVYKGAGSILKSVSIIAAFSGITGAATSGVTRDGKLTTSISEGGTEVVLYKGQMLTPQNPGSTSASSKKISKSSTRGGTSTGKVEVHPEIDNKTNTKVILNADANCSGKQIALEFVTLGHHSLEPGQTIHFKNIGQRYSGKYHVQTVTHIIDSSGYICRGAAYGYGLSGGVGVTPNKSIPGEENEATLNPVQLYDKAPKSLSNAAKGLSTGGSAKAKYDKTR